MMYKLWFATAVLAVMPVSACKAQSDLRFANACDGSAAAELADGRIAVADDEHSVLHVYRFDGGAPEDRDRRAFLGFGADASDDEADIEGAVRLGDRIYWIGSHSRSKKGKPRPERHILFATSSDPSLTPVGTPARALLATLLRAQDERGADEKPSPLGQAMALLNLPAIAAKPVGPEQGGINIEGLAAGPGGSLLIGFRSPRANETDDPAKRPALLIPLLNPAAVVDQRAVPRFGMPIPLDLAGLGVRDLLRRANGEYVIVAGTTEDDGRFALYSWAGPGGATPVELPADLNGLRPEAVVERGGKLLLLSDDGDDTCKAAPPSARSFAARMLP